MFSYIKAEFYRTRKRLPIILLFIFGVVGIGLSYYTTVEYTRTKSASTFLFQVAQTAEQVVIFITLMLATVTFKRREEMRNYLQKGNKRLNPVIGDYIVATCYTILFAFIFGLISVLLSKTLSQTPNEFYDGMNTSMFIRSIYGEIIFVFLTLGGVNMFYELTNLQGATVAIGILYYMFVPMIFITSGLSGMDTWIGHIADYFVKLAPYNYGNEIANWVQMGVNPFREGWFTAMVIVNVVVFTIIRYIVINRKKY